MCVRPVPASSRRPSYRTRCPERDAGPAQDNHVVLDVLSDLLDVRVFKDGSQQFECLDGIQLGLALRSSNRYVVGDSFFPRERITDDLGPTGVGRRGLGVDRDTLLLGELRDKFHELVARGHRCVVGNPFNGRFFLGSPQQTFSQPAEAEFAAQFFDRLSVESAGPCRFPIQRNRYLVIQSHELSAQQHDLLSRGQVFLPLLAGDFVQVFENALQRLILA